MNSDIALTRALLERLVIVDDSIIIYNAYKNNTIRISKWNKQMKKDRSLLDCLEIIQQLNSNQLTDVTKDL